MIAQEPQEPPKSKPFILVVDDSPDDWFLIQRSLSHHFPQVQAVWLNNADDVIPYLETHHRAEDELPDLITLDLYLPDVNTFIPTAQAGVSVIQALKSHHVYRRIPLVTLSWSAHADDVAEALKYSTNLYLLKPSDYSGWEAIVTEIHQYVPRLTQQNAINS